MPWHEVSTMSLRNEFVMLAQCDDAKFSGLCRRYGISRKTGYKWLHRFTVEGPAGLADRSRRPQRCPHHATPEAEQAVLAVRQHHPAWGARKIRARLPDHIAPPGTSTITRILRRHGLLDPSEAAKHKPCHRFEHAHPNDLWQMDFKGDFALPGAPPPRCYPLTVLDDHSRFALALVACANQLASTVQAHLTTLFRRYGLPWRMTMDQGPPWGAEGQARYTALTVWLIRLGVQVSHSRPFHPQTQGKDERFHRTLQAELLKGRSFENLEHCQRCFDTWREVYNLERPHEALGLAVPASQYQVSGREFPEVLPAIDYGPDSIVRRVQGRGEISFQGRTVKIGKAFRGQPIGLRSTTVDGVWDAYFCHQCITHFDLRTSVPS
jgi:transposase InsO family protein